MKIVRIWQKGSGYFNEISIKSSKGNWKNLSSNLKKDCRHMSLGFKLLASDEWMNVSMINKCFVFAVQHARHLQACVTVKLHAFVWGAYRGRPASITSHMTAVRQGCLHNIKDTVFYTVRTWDNTWLVQHLCTLLVARPTWLLCMYPYHVVPPDSSVMWSDQVIAKSGRCTCSRYSAHWAI